MCILLYQPEGHEFRKDEIEDFAFYNPDGFGAMRVHNGRVETFRLCADHRKIWKAYRRQFAGRECALHFRQATHGAVNRSNTHPFHVRDGIWLAHNGILSNFARSKAQSDTATYAAVLARRLQREPDAYADKDKWIRRIDKEIGAGNRIIFAAADGYRIVGENRGRWHNGAWYSNDYAWTSPYFQAYEPNWWTDYTGGAKGVKKLVHVPDTANFDISNETAGTMAGDIAALCVDLDEQDAAEDLITWLTISPKCGRDTAIDAISDNYPSQREKIKAFLHDIFDMALTAAADRILERQTFDGVAA